MRPTGKFAAIFAGIIGLSAAGCANMPATGIAMPQPPLAQDRHDPQLRADLEAAIAHGVIPGAIVHIARGDRILVHETVGSAEPGGRTPLDENAIFRLFSMTKPVTSVGIMILAERGVLSLGDPASKFLPELSDMRVYRSGGRDDMVTSPAKRQITIADLLSHSSGIVYHFTGTTPVHQYYRRHGVLRDTPVGRTPQDGEPARNLDELVARIGAAPLLFDPGERFHYSYSTTLLGALIERASGKRLDAFLKEAIFAPLGMNDTTFVISNAQVARLTPLYRQGPDGLILMESPGQSEYRDASRLLDGGGALAGTAGDYLRFARMLANSGELDGQRILSRKGVQALAAPRVTVGQLPGKSPMQFGYGLAVGTTDSGSDTWYPGGTVGWAGSGGTYFFIDPKSRSVALLMTNVLMGADMQPARTLQPIVNAAARRSGAFPSLLILK